LIGISFTGGRKEEKRGGGRRGEKGGGGVLGIRGMYIAPLLSYISSFVVRHHTFLSRLEEMKGEEGGEKEKR